MKTTITICDTCKTSTWIEGSEKRDGERLAELVENAAKESENLVIRRQSCLMGCDFACNIAIQGSGKLDYVLGKFEPSNEDAQGIVEYALLHQASETGQVPFKTWPQAIKGHFRARLPILEE